jgi:hypothetical protein
MNPAPRPLAGPGTQGAWLNVTQIRTPPPSHPRIHLQPGCRGGRRGADIAPIIDLKRK